MKENWEVRRTDSGKQEAFSKVFGIDKYISSILVAKGQDNIVDAYNFLNPRLSSLHSPFLMKGMDDAVKRIRFAVASGENIGIFTDSDLDGLTSLAIMLNLFQRMGIEPYSRYAVFDEDYGLRSEVIREFGEKGIKLLITLDCGIRDVAEIALAAELGIDSIVCDHHEQGDVLPDAIIVNPKQRDCLYPFKELAGVGVAFKLCHGLLMSYLQSFNKLFLLLAKDGADIYSYYIRNGIVEKSEIFSDVGRLSQNGSPDNIIFYDMGSDEARIREMFAENMIYDLNDLITSYAGDCGGRRQYGIDDICAIFSVKEFIFANRGELVKHVFSEIEYNHSPRISEFIDSTIDLVSLGTIADIMPVHRENRIIVHHGIRSMNSTVHPGLSLLVGRIGGTLSSKNVAWDISPLLNTPGRFGRTDLTAKFFIEKDEGKLAALLCDIEALNSGRKKIINDLLKSLHDDIDAGRIDTGRNIVWITSNQIPDGLTGLIANRISEHTGKPVIIVSMNGKKDSVKGSGRSTGGINFFSYFEPLSFLFERIGGHPNAFGFTANINNLELIREKAELAVEGNFSRNDITYFDAEIPLEAVNVGFIKSLSLFEPYGYQNEECVFLTRDVRIREFRRFGNDRGHGKFIFTGSVAEAIGWNMANKMEKYFFDKKKADIIYKLENNEFNGRIIPRMLILDFD